MCHVSMLMENNCLFFKSLLKIALFKLGEKCENATLRFSFILKLEVNEYR